jgi:putative transcriptional regulator
VGLQAIRRGGSKTGAATRPLIAAEIQKVRLKLGMSQAEFAHTFWLNVRTLQDWEIGRKAPSDAAAVLLFLIPVIPGPILKALKRKDARPGGEPG